MTLRIFERVYAVVGNVSPTPNSAFCGSTVAARVVHHAPSWGANPRAPSHHRQTVAGHSSQVWNCTNVAMSTGDVVLCKARTLAGRHDTP